MIPQKEKNDPEVLLTHVFRASREKVFRAWTDPEQLLKWYAPKSCRIFYKQIDVRPGGTYHSCIQDPVHGLCWCKGTYLEITAPEKLVYTIELTDEDGNEVQSGDVRKDDHWPEKTILTVTFTEQEGNTLVTLHQTVSARIAAGTGALGGWVSMLEQLSEQFNHQYL